MPILYACEGPPHVGAPDQKSECREIEQARFGIDQNGKLRPAPPANWRLVDVPGEPRLALLCPKCGDLYDNQLAPPLPKRRFAVLDGGKD